MILADEPTGNLDSRTAMEVVGLLKMTCREFNQTVVMVTHEKEIADMADEIIFLRDGKSRESGKEAKELCSVSSILLSENFLIVI